MRIKGIYASRPAYMQLLLLLMLLLIGIVIASLLSAGLTLMKGTDTNLLQDPDSLRWTQLISAICTFMLPAIALAYLCSDKVSAYLSFKKITDEKVWGLLFLSMFLISPAVNLLGTLNEQMNLPEFMAPIERWMRAQEDLAEELTDIMLKGEGIGVLLMNLIVIAVAAGFTEEFLFRGALQRVVERWTSNPHIVIWIVAILFSAFHLQFYGFIPRMLLGAYFGYLLYWGKSIWLPVFAHFMNNAYAVCIMSDSHLAQNGYLTGEVLPHQLLGYSIIAIIGLAIFIPVNQKIYHSLRCESGS